MSSLAQKREMLVAPKRQLQFREKHIKAEIKKVESQIAEITAAEVSYASEMKQAKRARAILLPLLSQQEAVKFERPWISACSTPKSRVNNKTILSWLTLERAYTT